MKIYLLIKSNTNETVRKQKIVSRMKKASREMKEPGGKEKGFDGDFDRWIIIRGTKSLSMIEMNWIGINMTRDCSNSEKTVEEKGGFG
jgi:phosphomannomutase